jgi:hypothetical protein
MHVAAEEELRRLVEASWWEWMPGMLVRVQWKHRRFVARVEERVVADERIVLTGDEWAWHHELMPVPSDPATAGCLMDLCLRGAITRLVLNGLAAMIPGPEHYASFGDFLVAVLLADGGGEA